MSLAVFLKYNSRILLRKNFLVGIAYGLIVPFIFNLSHPVMISEVYLSVVGIIFLTQLSEIDKEDGMNELVAVRRKGVYYNFLSRYGLGLIIITTILAWFMSYLSFTYFLFELMTGGDYTGDLYLFSLSRGDFFPKYYLLGMSILLIAFNLVCFKYKTVTYE